MFRYNIITLTFQTRVPRGAEEVWMAESGEPDTGRVQVQPLHVLAAGSIQYSTVQYSFSMSSLQDSWKMDDTGIDFVLNRKFPRDTKDMSLVSGWYIIAIEIPPEKIT